jgi:hypothetical protein
MLELALLTSVTVRVDSSISAEDGGNTFFLHVVVNNVHCVNIYYTFICNYRRILLLITLCLSIRHEYVD